MSNKHHENREKRLDEPLEDADAVECDVPAGECELRHSDREGDAFKSEASYRDEIDEAFKPVTIAMVASPVDGLPIPANERSDLALAHPFTRETVVCVEDDSAYVELWAEELEGRDFSHASGLTFDSNTSFAGSVRVTAVSRFDLDGKPRERREFAPDRVLDQFGVKVVDVDGDLVPVRMRRERCKHFMRQVMANDDQPIPGEFGHFLRFYNCAARRSVGGALMTLRDEAMYACDYRDPVDPVTAERYLDSFDRERLGSKRHLEMVRPFALKD